MNLIHHFLQEMSMLFLIAAAGYVCGYRKIFSKAATTVFMQVLLYVTLPALICYSLNIPFHIKLLKDFLWLILMSVYILGISAILAAWMKKCSGLPERRQSVFEGLIIFGNQGFIGYAITYILFGETGVLYATVFNICYFIFIWTYGVWIFARGKEHIRWKEIFLNPGLIATACGLLIMLLPAGMPALMANTLEMTGKMTIPLSMLMIGTLLSEIRLPDVGRSLFSLPLWQSAVAKLLLIPLLLFPFLLFKVPASLFVIAVLVSGMPSAPTISLFSHKYGDDATYASLGVFLSTVLSLVTIPALYMTLVLFL